MKLVQEVISKPRQFCFDTALRVQDKKRAPGAPRNGTSLSLGPVAWGVSAKEPGAAVVGSAHPRAPSSALPRLRPEWRQGQGWKEDEIQGGWGGGGQPHLGLRDAGCHGHPVYATRPGGGGRRAGPLQHQGGRGQQRPRLGGASPAAGCAAAAPGPCSSPAPGGALAVSPGPGSQPRHRPAARPRRTGGTGGYPGGLLRAVPALGNFGKRGARSPEWGLGESRRGGHGEFCRLLVRAVG